MVNRISRRRALQGMASATVGAAVQMTAGGGMAQAKSPTLTGAPPLVIAHRGASGYRPEHTLEAYKLAIDMGADFIEPDLVITKDGALVARHDTYLSTTTDVADRPEFADRKRTRDGRRDWFVDDFTLAEIRTLKARQGFPGRSREWDDRFAIPTFDDVLQLATAATAARGRPIGVYPETKKPGYFSRIGLDFTAPLLAALARHGYGTADRPAFIQSFEADILRQLRPLTTVPLVMRVFPRRARDRAASPGEPNLSLEQVAEVADAVGPFKGLVMTDAGRDTGFVGRAHALGLAVHPWTFRNDRLPGGVTDPADELGRFFALGVDGVFSDFPDTAVAARSASLAP